MSMDAIIDFYAEWRLKGPVTMVLIANLPQLIISFLYLALNGIWTVMLVEVEWNSYGTTRKSLRTSYPIGQQRRTYWLSLPLVSIFKAEKSCCLLTAGNRDSVFLSFWVP